MRLRPSPLAQLLGLALACELALGVAWYYPVVFADALLLATVALLVVSISRAWNSPDRSRWLGFAVLGWGFAIVSGCLSVLDANERMKSGIYTSPFDHLAFFADRFCHRLEPAPETHVAFKRCGQALFCLAFGWAGASLAISPEGGAEHPPAGRPSPRRMILGIALLSAAGLLALWSRSVIASEFFVGAVLALLLASTLLSLRGRDRDAWLGFAIFGWNWALFAILLYPASDGLYKLAFPAGPFPGTAATKGVGEFPYVPEELTVFRRVVQALLCLGFGLAGSFLMRRLDLRGAVLNRLPSGSPMRKQEEGAGVPRTVELGKPHG